MNRLQILSDEQFGKLSTDQKHAYINEMLRHIVQSRPNGSNGGERRERAPYALNDAEYLRMSDGEKLRYLESMTAELMAAVLEAQRALRALRLPQGPGG